MTMLKATPRRVQLSECSYIASAIGKASGGCSNEDDVDNRPRRVVDSVARGVGDGTNTSEKKMER